MFDSSPENTSMISFDSLKEKNRKSNPIKETLKRSCIWFYYGKLIKLMEFPVNGLHIPDDRTRAAINH